MTLPVPAPCAAEWDLFHHLLPAPLLNDLDPKAAQAVYTPFLVTWLLIYQRLHGNATLNDAVTELTHRFPPQALPPGSRARQGTLSANSGAYSLARTRLHDRVLRAAADHVYQTLLDSYPPSWRGRRAFLVDGSTVQLASTPTLRAAFPPASNQHGCSHWPILHLAVAHELASGLAAFPEHGPMYGPQATSELALAQRLVRRLPAGSILLGDRNFGVFAFAWAARQAGQDVLLRLSRTRFANLRKKAEPVGPAKWAVTWRPSRWDRQAHPDLPAGAEVRGWLHEVAVTEKLTLWLFETVDGTGTDMAGLYRQRLDVETDIRDVKITLRLDQMKGKSVAMMAKELTVGLLAYNLANQVRRLAAARLQLPPRRLSFAGTWSLLKGFLAGVLEGKSAAQAEAEFERLLKAAGQRKLPNRRPGRSYPREVIARRRKFPVRKRLKVATE
jgi:hypothetical protein